MDSGDETSLTEIAPPVLQNLGREISWIDATAGVAIVTDIESVDLLEGVYTRADTSAHISLREIYCSYNNDCRAASHLRAHSSRRCFDAAWLLIRSAFTEPEDRRCGGRLRQNWHGVDTARRTWGRKLSEEGLTMALLFNSKYGDHELERYNEPRSMH